MIARILPVALLATAVLVVVGLTLLSIAVHGLDGRRR